MASETQALFIMSYRLPVDANLLQFFASLLQFFVAVVAGFIAWLVYSTTRKLTMTEQFIEMRARAIGSDFVNRRNRVLALLMDLKEKDIETNKLEFSPDLTLFLNDYQWIGRLVEEKMLRKEYAMATYGRDLLLFYEQLKPYMEKERTLRDYASLWEAVDRLHKKFEKLNRKRNKKTLTKDDIDRLLKIETRWLRPSTILIGAESMQEEIEVDKLAQDAFKKYKNERNRLHLQTIPSAFRDISMAGRMMGWICMRWKR
jgi:hypothetical protein